MAATAPSPAIRADVRRPWSTLVELSHAYGSDPEFVLAGGGNTSVKLGDHLLVKASGDALCGPSGPRISSTWTGSALQALLERDLSTVAHERRLPSKRRCWRRDSNHERMQRPSVEAVLHHLMPSRFVVHLHPTLVNHFSCCRDGARLVEGNLGEEWSGSTSSTPASRWPRHCGTSSSAFTGQDGHGTAHGP